MFIVSLNLQSFYRNYLRSFSLFMFSAVSLEVVCAEPRETTHELEHSRLYEHSLGDQTEGHPIKDKAQSNKLSKLFRIDQRILEITRQRRETQERLHTLRVKKSHYLADIKTLSQSLREDRITLIKLLSIKERVRSTRIVELLLSADGPLDQKRREVYIQAIFDSGSRRFKTLLKSKYELEYRQRATERLRDRESKLTELLETQSQSLNVERQEEWLAISNHHESSMVHNHSNKVNVTQNITPKEHSQKKRLWENITRLPPTQGQWVDEFRKFRGVERAKMYGGGIWILNQSGAPVYSADHGQVIFSSQVRGWGGLVLIQHQYGYISIYGNLSGLMVSEGQEIKMQEKIGSIGSTMSREGLYFELRRGGELIHPSRWLSQELSSIQGQVESMTGEQP